MTEKHGRGSLSEYERYLQGMDASMRQKVALTAAHLLAEGRVADAGMGSGSGSHALARLYPALEVIGVDLDPAMVSLARSKYALPNLRFVESDIGAPFAPEASLDGILDSSVLHHVSTFTGYSYDAVRRTLASQVRLLKRHGVLIVRDFVAPPDEPVFLDVRSDDGDESDDPRACSTASLLERFAREFRSLHATPGFALERVTTSDVLTGFARYALSLRHATEFILRKDYRADWEAEVREEYCYYTQREFEAELRSLGLRVLASTPIFNPWIVDHRYEGKIELRRRDGTRLPFPPTNYVIVGQRVDAAEGVAFRSHDSPSSPSYLELSSYRDLTDGRIVDLVRRPNVTVDVVPWFLHDDRVYVLARTSYPRPILGLEPHAIDGSTVAEYVTEPITFVLGDAPLAASIEALLIDHVHLEPSALRRFDSGGSMLPSPGGIEEEIRTMFVEIDPVFVRADLGARSGFSTSGHVHAIEAEQVLRAAQVGGLPDARLEMSVRTLLRRLGRETGPWIGAAVEMRAHEHAAHITSLEALFHRPRRRRFRRTQTSEIPFIAIRSRLFEELDAEARSLHLRSLEYAMPRTHSATSLALAVMRRTRDEWLIGLVDDDRAAAQNFNGHSNLLTTPAWRLPVDCASLEQGHRFVREALRREHGVTAARFIGLGGAYYPSPGVTPERVHPFVATVGEIGEHPTPLEWVPLRELVRDATRIEDAHLRIVALRTAHAVGLDARAELGLGTD